MTGLLWRVFVLWIAVFGMPQIGAAQAGDNGFVVVLDPGHGGIDPGASGAGLIEAELMLSFAVELQTVLTRTPGTRVILTREGDNFVPLTDRLGTASASNASVFISLHADALEHGAAQGATLYTLAPFADDLGADIAARHAWGAGDAVPLGDDLTRVLIDLERQETAPRARDLARAIIQDIGRAGGPLNTHALREGDLMVLRLGSIPSVLIELGFLSSPRDAQNLQDPEWRKRMAGAIAGALHRWQQDDAALRKVSRQ